MAKLFVSESDDGIEVRGRMEDDEGRIGDLHVFLQPGDPFLGRSFDYWRAAVGTDVDAPPLSRRV
jgi:hypothetical protein